MEATTPQSALDGKIQVLQGDITKMKVDAVVNAANKQLAGGGGVDGAIHKAGGPVIMEECREIVNKRGELPTGEAAMTIAGKMPARFVIHTVGPVWQGGEQGEAELLAAAYRNSLALAEDQGCKSVAFPNISTGVYGFPKDQAAEIAWQTVTQWLQEHALPKTVYFVCFDEENYHHYLQRLSS